jgi:hypothetical protein
MYIHVRKCKNDEIKQIEKKERKNKNSIWWVSLCHFHTHTHTHTHTHCAPMFAALHTLLSSPPPPPPDLLHHTVPFYAHVPLLLSSF